jgi:5-methylcytosine-specific restriction endonuclease McrA
LVENVRMRGLCDVSVGSAFIKPYRSTSGRLRLAGLQPSSLRKVHEWHIERAEQQAAVWLSNAGRFVWIHVMEGCELNRPVVFVSEQGTGLIKRPSLNETIYQALYETCDGTCCSDLCVQAPKHGAIRWQRIKRAGYQPGITWQEIAIRDQWTCQLCGLPTPKELRGQKAPSAPEIDHIVPVSKGGSHTRDNLQLLCRRCNGRKGARTMTHMQTLHSEAHA